MKEISNECDNSSAEHYFADGGEERVYLYNNIEEYLCLRLQARALLTQ